MVQIGAVDKDSKYAMKRHQNLVSVANENYFGIQEQLAELVFYQDSIGISIGYYC
jgi:hypothetical protein